MKHIKLLLLLIVSFSSFTGNGQESFINPYNFQDEIAKNILLYRIRNSNDYFDDKTGTYNGPAHHHKFTELLPSEGYKLKIFVVKERDLTFPDTSYLLYKVLNENYTYESNEYEKKSTYKSDPLSKKYLIGIKKDKIIYLSGMFYKTKISGHFDLNIKDVNSFIKYINIKLYNYTLSNIVYSNTDDKYIYFKGYSEVLENDILIKICKDDYDMIIVEKS